MVVNFNLKHPLASDLRLSTGFDCDCCHSRETCTPVREKHGHGWAVDKDSRGFEQKPTLTMKALNSHQTDEDLILVLT